MSWQPQHHLPSSSGPSSQAPALQSAPPDLTFLVATDPESLAATSPLPFRTRGDRNEAYSRKKQQRKEWLDIAWGGDSWLPTDLREGLASFGLAEPAAGVTVALKDITRLAQRDSLHLDSLWHQGGILREAVSRDLQERANNPKTARSRPLKPHLTAAIAKSVLGSLRQPTPTPSFDSSFTPLTEQPDDDDDDSCGDFSFAPFGDNPASASTATAAMGVALAESRMDVDPVSNKRRLSMASLASIRGDKKMRTAAFAAANTVLTALSTSSSMSSDVMRILGRLLSAQSRDETESENETDTASLCWIDPIQLEPEAASLPAQLESLSLDRPVAVGIFTTLPSEHWCFAVLKQVGQTIHLRLHDCQPSDERLGIIKNRFEVWISASAQSSGIQVVAETCPPLHGANWSSGLHALSCFRRTLRGESCSELMPFVAANEQKFHLDLIRKAIPSCLNSDECKILAAVQALQDDRDLINKPIEELNQQRAQVKADLENATRHQEIEDKALLKLINDMQTQRETNRKFVQLAQQRADTFKRQYRRRLSLAEIQDKADRNTAADEALRLAEEQLERAKAAKEERQTEYELATDKHDEALIETGDWDMYLGSLEGLFDGGSG